jgi:hypothetical protein
MRAREAVLQKPTPPKPAALKKLPPRHDLDLATIEAAVRGTVETPAMRRARALDAAEAAARTGKGGF